MKKTILPFTFFLALSPLSAQIHVQIDIGLPPAPPLVVVQPGVQVVEGFHDEVFFNDGWYWCRRPEGWFRARSPRERFTFVEMRRVPRTLVRMPPGHYKNWHHEEKGRGPEYAPGQMKHRGGPESEREGHGRGKGHGKGQIPPPPMP